MPRWTRSVPLIAAVALCAPAGALASELAPARAAASESCGGTSSLYCIAKESTFAFTRLRQSPKGCSIVASFAVKPKIAGAGGHASLRLLGVSRRDRSIERSAHPSVPAGVGPISYRFTGLRTGSYTLTGWYEGDSARTASTHVTKRLALRCG